MKIVLAVVFSEKPTKTYRQGLYNTLSINKVKVRQNVSLRSRICKPFMERKNQKANVSCLKSNSQKFVMAEIKP